MSVLGAYIWFDGCRPTTLLPSLLVYVAVALRWVSQTNHMPANDYGPACAHNQWPLTLAFGSAAPSPASAACWEPDALPLLLLLLVLLPSLDCCLDVDAGRGGSCG
jgi:hypothetical protein